MRAVVEGQRDVPGVALPGQPGQQPPAQRADRGDRRKGWASVATVA